MLKLRLWGLSVPELLSRVWNAIWEDRCLGTAAELGFFFMMSLFPFLIFLISFLTFIPGTRDLMVGYLSRFVPEQVMILIRAWVDTVFSDRSGGLLSFSVIFTLWTASTGTAALIDLLNIAYDVGEGRSFWKTRWIAAWLTLVLTMFVIGGAVIIIFGQQLLEFLLKQFGLKEAFPDIGFLFGYFVGFAMLFLGLGSLYYFGPNVRQRWNWILPGTSFALVSILAVSYAFSFYLTLVPSFNLTYGGLATAIVLMFWLYLISLMILIGGEINSEIHRAARLPKIEKEKPKE